MLFLPYFKDFPVSHCPSVTRAFPFWELEAGTMGVSHADVSDGLHHCLTWSQWTWRSLAERAARSTQLVYITQQSY
jgi:hypothetical protein